MKINRVDENFAVAPQIAPDDMTTLAQDGFTTVICNRPDGEEPGQPDAGAMQAAAEKAGLSFYHIPVASGGFTPAAVEAFRDVRRGAGGPVLAYCRSGTRSITLETIANPEDREIEDRLRRAEAAGYDLSGLRGRID